VTSLHFDIGEMSADDYDEVLCLWQKADGVGLTDSDSREGVQAYLNRNPGLSLVARHHGRIVGAILCGHDGRRGYLHHLAVAAEHRRQGVGTALVQECLAGLAQVGIQKCHVWVYQANRDAQRFWEKLGWKDRTDLMVMSREIKDC
jgi:ribosomal protein S18 acetylase RimI-like enzyme